MHNIKLHQNETRDHSELFSTKEGHEPSLLTPDLCVKFYFKEPSKSSDGNFLECTEGHTVTFARNKPVVVLVFRTHIHKLSWLPEFAVISNFLICRLGEIETRVSVLFKTTG